MKDSLRPGLTRTTSYQTTIDMRARQLKADVFSTPSTITWFSLMERTCTDLTEPFLDDNEQTVGIHIDVRHLASTRIGQSVTMNAAIIEVKGRKIRYAVEAFNDAGVKIGAGTQWRALVDTQRFACGIEQEVDHAR